MAEIVNIYDGGITKDPRGRTVGVILFRISTNEGQPEEIIGHCLPNYRDSIIKNLKRLAWQKPAQPMGGCTNDHVDDGDRTCRVCGCTQPCL